MNHRESRGRRILVAILAVTLAMSSMLLAYQTFFGNFKLTSVIRTCIEFGLFYQVWRGMRWARWLMTGLYALAGCYGVILSLRYGLPTAISLLLIGVIYYVFALLLAWSPDVHAFLLAKRNTESKPFIDADFA